MSRLESNKVNGKGILHKFMKMVKGKKKAKLGFKNYRWYGFDIDGTIADNSLHSWIIDKPIKPMVALMKRLHKQGMDVRILSGRLGDYPSDEEIPQSVRQHIWAWCDVHLGFRPRLTGRKDSLMEALYDDRAKQVVCNKGFCYEDINRELADCLLLALQKKSVTKDKDLFSKCKRVLKKMGYNA